MMEVGIRMITKEAAEKAVKQYGSAKKAAHAMGMCDKTIRKALKSGPSATPEAKPVEAVAKRHTISEKDLLVEIDPETRVTTALREILRKMPRSQYMRDYDVRKECHASDTTLWRDVRVQAEFWPYAMVVGNNADPMVYWGHPESVKSLIERGKARLPSWERK